MCEIKTMEQDQKNKAFFAMADSFIDSANAYCDEEKSSQVGSAMMFATARFSAFVVASHSPDREKYEAEIEGATDFFSQEFKRMLLENLEEYKTAFKDEPKYQHLMNKNKDDK